MARSASVSKDEIIESALTCFLEVGFEETTFKDIAQKAKIKAPSIYHYYSNKMDLLNGCCEWTAAKGREFILSHIDQKSPASERLNQYIDGNLRFFYGYKKEAFAMTAIYFFAQINPALRETYIRIQKNSIDTIEYLIVQISHEKGKSIKDTRVVAETIHSILVGEVYKTIHGKKPSKDSNVIQHIETLVNAAFN